MAKAKHSTKPRTDSEKPITAEERTLLTMYRELARWDRNFFFLILQSLVWGPYTPMTDKMSWDEIRRNSELSQSRKAVNHG